MMNRKYASHKAKTQFKGKRSSSQLLSAIVKLGELGLTTSDLEIIIHEAVRTIVSSLNIPFCSVYQLLPDGGAFMLGWGFGWKSGSIGQELQVSKGTQEGCTLVSEETLIVEDYGSQTDYARSSLLREHHIRSGVTVIIHNSGTPFGVMGVYTNIPRKFNETELHFLQCVSHIVSEVIDRREVEEALRMSEAKYQNLFEECTDVFFASTPAGELIDINPAGVRLFGYQSKDEMLKINIEMDLYADGTQRQHYKRTMSETGSVKDFEFTLKTKTGQLIFVQETSIAVRDEAGNIAAYQGLMKDVTRICQLEQELRRARKHS